MRNEQRGCGEKLNHDDVEDVEMEQLSCADADADISCS